MHYGLIYRVGDWQYDKHWYFDFDVHKCPPWPKAEKPKAGIFPPPPYPHQLPNKVRRRAPRGNWRVAPTGPPSDAMSRRALLTCVP